MGSANSCGLNSAAPAHHEGDMMIPSHGSVSKMSGAGHAPSHSIVGGGMGAGAKKKPPMGVNQGLTGSST